MIKLDILLSTKNDSIVLKRQIEALSKVKEYFNNLIISNDHSNIFNSEILDYYRVNFDFIQLYSSDKCGMHDSYNYALSKSNGTHVLFISSDDVINFEYIIAVSKYLNSSPNQPLICGLHNLIYKSYSNIDSEHHVYYDSLSASQFVSPHCFLDLFKNESFLYPSGCSIIYRRDILVSLKGYRKELGLYSDIFPFIIIALRYGFYFINLPASNVYIRRTSYNVLTAKNFKTRYLNSLEFLEALLQFPDLKSKFIYASVGKIAPLHITKLFRSRYYQLLGPFFSFKFLIVEMLGILSNFKYLIKK